MSILKKVLGKALVLVGFDPIVSGTVVGKSHYGTSGSSRQIMTTIGKGASQVVTFTTAPTTVESWEFTVKGVDRIGNQVREDVETDENTFNNTELGDSYKS
jgi:hypothetical protein